MYKLYLEKDFLYCNEDLYQKIHFPFFKRELFLPKIFESKEELDQWFYSLEYSVAKSYLLFLLNRRDYLASELETKFKRKYISLKTIQKLIKEFKHLGFIDDDRLISSYIEKYKHKKSPREIQFLLGRKGIGKEKFSELFIQSDEDQKTAIRKFALQKKNKDPKAVFAYLYRKGFSSQCIKEVLEDL